MKTESKNSIPDTLDLAIQGDQQSFAILYQENVQRIYNYIYYRTGNRSDSEDLTARVFQRAYKHINNYKKTSVPFSAWLYRIAHNLVANWHRDNSRRHEIPLEDQEFNLQHADQPESEVVKNQEVEGLLYVLHSMPVDRQQLIILKYLDDLSNLEIAQIMGRSEGAVKSLYHRTLLELREKLESRKS